MNILVFKFALEHLKNVAKTKNVTNVIKYLEIIEELYNKKEDDYED